ncbi:transporter substrate-binding domain-containing protein [Massilia sp. W12]|uniref:substrate-binding periplasmic protein n=1 Tax=Massilia sp. W12 TaxID=3126507 RepID=UPI0030D4DB11
MAQSRAIILNYTEYAPYSMEVNGQAQGLEIEVLQEALGRRMGLQLTHKILPWERAQQLVRAGLADGFVAVPTAERASYSIAASEPVAWWDILLYVRKQDARFDTVRDISALRPYKIGAVTGNSWVKSNLGGMDVLYLKHQDLLLNLLHKQRIDVIPENPGVMQQVIERLGLSGHITTVALPGMRQPMLLHIHPDSPLRARLAEFEETLRAMRKDGAMKKILARYPGMPL